MWRRSGLALLLIAAAGCSGEDTKGKKSTPPKPRLASLTTSVGALSPAFSPAVTSYLLAVPRDSAHVQLTPTAAGGASITLSQNGAASSAVASGAPSADLALPEPTAAPSVVEVAVSDSNGTTTYRILLSQLQSSDASLTDLVLSVGRMYPPFSSAETDYRVSVPDSANASTMTLTPTAASPHTQSIIVAQAGGTSSAVTSGSASQDLVVPPLDDSTDVTVTITAEDGTVRVYALEIIQTVLSDASLIGLEPSAGQLVPDFDRYTVAYEVAVPNGSPSVTITPTTNSPAAFGITVSQDGGAPMAVLNGEASEPLVVPLYGESPSLVDIEVTAEDEISTEIYTVAVTEAPAGDSSLFDLTVSAGALSPAFFSSGTDYALMAPNGTTSITVTPTSTLRIHDITVSQDGSGVVLASGESTAVLVPAPGETSEVSVTVTSQDEQSVTTYTLWIGQAALGTTPDVWFHDDFATTDNWDLTPGTGLFSLQADPYDATNQVLQFVAGGTYAQIAGLIKDSVWSGVTGAAGGDYYIEARFSPYSNGSIADPGGGTTGQKQLYMMGRYQDATNFYAGGLNLQINSDRRAELRVFKGGTNVNPIETRVNRNDIIRGFFDGIGTDATPNTSGRWYRVRMDMVSNNLTLYLDGEEIGTGYTDASNPFGPGKIGLYAHNPPFLVDDIRVGDPSIKPVALYFYPFDRELTVDAFATPHQVDVTAMQADGLTPDAFSVISSNPSVVAVVRDGNTVTMSPLSEGTADVTFTSGSDPSLWKAIRFIVGPAKPDEAHLLSLAPSVGAFDVAFSPIVMGYNLVLANGTPSISFSAVPVSSRATVTVSKDGGPAQSSSTAFLPPPAYDPYVLSFVVTAEDGVATQTYTVSVGQLPSADDTLSGLAVSAGALDPPFSAGQLSYTLEVPSGAAAITVTPTSTSAMATITLAQDGNGAPILSGNASGDLPLVPGVPSVIDIVVTAEDGHAPPRTYTITATRIDISNAFLADIGLSDGSLVPNFDGSETNYDVVIPNGTTDITVTATAFSPNATSIAVKQDGVDVDTDVAIDGSEPVGPMAVPPPPDTSTSIEIIVTAEDGFTTKTYTLTVSRAANDDATLTSLVPSAGSLDRPFVPGSEVPADLVYDLVVPNGTATVNLTATPTAGVDATVLLTPPNPITVPPYGSSTEITVHVTAQDGSTTLDYTVTLSQLPSSDATLTALTPTGSGTLGPTFGSALTSYALVVPNGTTTITVTPSATAPIGPINVTLTPGGAMNDVTAGNPTDVITVPNAGEPTLIEFEVTAQDGFTTKTYSIQLTQATALPPAEWYSDHFEVDDPAADDWDITPLGADPGPAGNPCITPPNVPCLPYRYGVITDPMNATNHALMYVAGNAGNGVPFTLKAPGSGGPTIPDTTNFYYQARVAFYANLSSYGTSNKQVFLIGRYDFGGTNNFVLGGWNRQTPVIGPPASGPSRVEAGHRIGGTISRPIQFVTWPSPGLRAAPFGEGGWAGDPYAPDAATEWLTVKFAVVENNLKVYFDDGTAYVNQLVGTISPLPAAVIPPATLGTRFGVFVNNKSFLMDDIAIGRSAPTLVLDQGPTWDATVTDQLVVTVLAEQVDELTADTFAVNSLNPTVVSVERTDVDEVTLHANSAGPATITFTSGSNSLITKTITATITP